MSTKTGILAATCPLIFGWAAAIQAQTTPHDAATITSLEEIVVTAQRKEQNLQDVPITITVLTAEAMANSGIHATADLVAVTPGLSISGFQHGAKIFLRGVGTPSIIPGDEASVASYVDGVYVGTSYSAAMQFNNVDRVEVLKGPQGTLFGRNATGGLINVITRDPKAGLSGEAGVDYANYNTVTARAYVSNGTDRLAGDVAVYYVDQGKGWGRNLVSGQEVNFQRETAIRSKWVWRPTADDKFTFIADWQQSHSDQGFTRADLPGSIYSSGGPTRPATVYTGSIYDSVADIQSSPDNINVRSSGVSLRYERSLGSTKVSLLTAYRLMRLNSVLDTDTTPYPISWFTQQYYDKGYQNELLFTGDHGRLDWTAGAFIYNDATAQDPVSVFNSTANFARIETHSYSGFAQGTYSIADATRLTLGARYTTDERRLSAARFLNVGGIPSNNQVGTPTLVVSDADHHVTYNKLTYQIGLDHKFGDRIMAYITQKRGFKSGDYNTSNPTQAPVAPEVLDATEVGLKSELFDQRVRLNASAFYYSFKDIQLARQIFDPVLGIISQTVNAAKARQKGVDVDAIFAPHINRGRLDFRAGVEFLDAKYTSFPNGPISVPNGQPRGGNSTLPNLANPTPTNLTGNRVIQAPKFSGNLTVDYFVPAGAGELGFTVNGYHNSGFFFEPDNRLSQPAFTLLNAQVTYNFGSNDRYQFRVFGTNLSDVARYAGLQGGSFGDNVAPAPPRVIGAGFEMKL
jgi:iron complex outermembrane receptor protein